MKIGIVSPLWERGLSYTALSFYQALSGKHEKTGMLAYVSKIKGTPRVNLQNEFDMPNLCVYPNPEILPEDLKLWAKPYDVILFMEERFGGLLRAMKEMGKKTIAYVSENMWPMERKAVAEASDLLVSPNEIEGTQRIKLGVDVGFFKPIESPEKRKKTRIFAPMGWGGDYDRRNDQAISAALSRVQCRDKTEICMHRQGSPQTVIDHMVSHVTKLFSRKEMMEAYAKSDVCVWLPKWRRSDLTPMEAMACGLVVVGWDGVGFTEEKHPGLFGEAKVPNVHELAVKVVEASEGDLERGKREAREMTTDCFDWEKNKRGFLELVESI